MSTRRKRTSIWPTLSEVVEEMRAIGKISIPTAVTGLVLYSRAMISMLFLGYLGDLELAGGSLSIGFANITGYSVLSGLAMGMEPICGAKQRKLLSLTLQRTMYPPPPLCFPSHLLPLAQHEENSPMVRLGREHLLRRPHLHHLRPPRPRLPLLPPPS